MSTLLVVTALVGLGIGIWLGMPGRYSRDIDDIEKVMDSGIGRRRRTKRVFTPLAWMQRKVSSRGPSDDRRRGGRRRSGFNLESPDERER